MNVVEVHEKIQKLEREHAAEIKRIKLLGCHVWPALRLLRTFAQLPKSKSSQNKPLPELPFFGSWIRRAFERRNRIILFSTSAAYSAQDGDKLTYPRMKMLQDTLGKENVLVMCLLREEERAAHEAGRLDPPIDIPYNFAHQVARKWHAVLKPIATLYAKRHRKRLKLMEISKGDAYHVFIRMLTEGLLFGLVFLVAAPKRLILLSASYGKESVIMPLKWMGVPSMEFQHGAIFKEHFGYNFDGALADVKATLTVPDRILTFGDYWAETISSNGLYPQADCPVVGNFTISRKDVSPPLSEGTRVLLTSQPSYVEFFQQFIRNYIDQSEYAPQTKFTIKPHPRESAYSWDSWRALEKEYPAHVEVSEEGTYELMASHHVQFTRESSTIYEMMYFGKMTFAVPSDDFGMDKTGLWQEGLVIEVGEDYLGDFLPEEQSERFKELEQKMWEPFSGERLIKAVA